MTPEAWTVIVVRLGLAGLDAHVGDQGENLARLEGQFDALITMIRSETVAE